MEEFSINKIDEYLEKDKKIAFDYCKQYEFHYINIVNKCKIS